MTLLRSMVVARPAIERNTGRTLTRVPPGVVFTEPGEPCTATATRVLAGLTGLWLAQGPACRPDYAVHPDGCAHRPDWFSTTLRALAREMHDRTFRVFRQREFFPATKVFEFAAEGDENVDASFGRGARIHHDASAVGSVNSGRCVIAAAC